MRLGSYRLLAPLGLPAAGQWYRAIDERDGRRVRIVVRWEHAADDAWNGLCERLRLLRAVEHPAIVPLVETAFDHAPPYAVAADPVGTSLEAHRQTSRTWPEAAIVAFGTALCDALAAAHRIGLVHGSVGPACIALAPFPQPRLDFVIAVRTEGGATVDSRPGGGPEREVEPAKDSPSKDLRDLGVVLYRLMHGADAAIPVGHSGSTPDEVHSLAQLVDIMLDAERAAEWTAERAHRQFLAIRGQVEQASRMDATGIAPPEEEPTTVVVREGAATRSLGRYRLLERLGEGALGVVYRGEDSLDGKEVAIKVLHQHLFAKPEVVRRFKKEARLLAEIRSPYVCGLLDFNEDRGTSYLVLELLRGRSLGDFLRKQGPLPQAMALAIVADAARGLAEAHRLGIVHRDVKPDNIFLEGPWENGFANPAARDPALRVRLCDFGLARHVEQSESLAMTRGDHPIGTPLYMAPEQAVGGEVRPSADVYALGATLFELLAGRPPFVAKTVVALMGMHAKEDPPSVQSFAPEASDAVVQTVSKMLAKDPDARFADGDELLRDLDRILRGEPTNSVAHPRLPDAKPEEILRFDWTWDLQSTPEELWPFVSNTERLNRAIGLAPVAYRMRSTEGQGSIGPRTDRFGAFRKAGLKFEWQEHPFEWIEGKRMCVLREYTSGVFRWMASIVELQQRADGGTTLWHRLRIVPRNWFGKLVASWEVGRKTRRALENVYGRIDAFAARRLPPAPSLDAFEPKPAGAIFDDEVLRREMDRLTGRGVAPVLAGTLLDFFLRGSDQAVARIRPLELARRLELNEMETVEACLKAAHAGVLNLLWDILCPQCRVASSIEETLRNIRSHGRCEACHLDFDVDFANSVEMIFRVHPSLRSSEIGVFCIGGPSHSPHVAAQVRAAPGERLELNLTLGEGEYRLRGPQLPYAIDFQVHAAARARRGEAALARGSKAGFPSAFKPGAQTLVLHNDHSEELVVRVERLAGRNDALTAARASALACFRELFPQEVLSGKQLVSVAHIVLLATELTGVDALYREWGDVRTFEIVNEHFRLVEEIVRREGGAVVKTVHEMSVAVFHDAVGAVRGALALNAAGAEAGRPRCGVRTGVHLGPAMAATVDGKLDYFGATVKQAMRLPTMTDQGVVLSQAAASDREVQTLLRTRGIACELLESSEDAPAYRLVKDVEAMKANA